MLIFMMHEVPAAHDSFRRSVLATERVKTVSPGRTCWNVLVMFPLSLTILYSLEMTQPLMLLLKFMLDIGSSDRVGDAVFGRASSVWVPDGGAMRAPNARLETAAFVTRFWASCWSTPLKRRE